MVFSLFGKKDDPPKKPDAGKRESGQTRPAQTDTRPAQPVAPAPADDDELSLDFTSFVPVAVTEDAPEPPPAAAQPVELRIEEPAAPSVIVAPAEPVVPEPPKAAPPAPAIAKPAAPAPAATKPAAPNPAAPKSAAPKPAAPKPAAAKPASPAAAAPLAAKPVSPPPAPSPAAAAPRPATPPAAAATPPVSSKAPKPPDSVMSIEVTTSSGMAPVVEEAAILFANAQYEEARETLAGAVRGNELGAAAKQVWLMLFDVYQHMGMRREFEELSIEFASRFERSPPAWMAHDPAPAQAMLATGNAAYLSLGDALGAASEPLLAQARDAAGKRQALRLDLGKLRKADAAGCLLLLQALQHLRRAGKDLMLSGEAQLIGLLSAQTPAGDRSVDQAFWLLLLEIYQTIGLQDPYEEAALSFAITYELSPPAWESARAAATPKASGKPESTQAEQALRLRGEITGADVRVLQSIVDYAAGVNPVLIDFSAVPRVDFVSAGQLLNTFSKLHKAGKAVKVRGANQLIVALFGVMGVHAVTGIENKR